MKQKSYKTAEKNTIIFMLNEENDEMNIQIIPFKGKKIDFTFPSEWRKELNEFFEVKK